MKHSRRKTTEQHRTADTRRLYRETNKGNEGDTAGATETMITERALEWTLSAPGTERALERTVGSRGGAGSGADYVGSGAVSVTTGLEFTGDMPAARTDLMGGSSSLHTSLGIPGCTAASTAVTRGTTAPSAATGGAVASSPTTWDGECTKESTNCPKFRWSSPLILHQLRGSSRALLNRSLRAASLYPNPSAAPRQPRQTSSRYCPADGKSSTHRDIWWPAWAHQQDRDTEKAGTRVICLDNNYTKNTKPTKLMSIK